MDDAKRLELIAEAVRYCQRAKAIGMPVRCYTKALREPIHFLWERRNGPKIRCAQFRSLSAAGMSIGKGLLIYDHAVPFNYLERELLSLDTVSGESVAAVLGKFGTIVFITAEDDSRLIAAGYSSKMPENWDRIDALARYRAVGIEVTENPQWVPLSPRQSPA